MVFDEIIRQGAQQYFVDKGVYRNPHLHGSDAFNAFERGWMQSLKKDEGRLVNAASPSVVSPRTNVSTRINASTLAEIQAERYRSRKG